MQSRVALSRRAVQIETFIPWTLVKRGIRREIITPLDAPQAITVEAAAERTKRKAVLNTPPCLTGANRAVRAPTQ